MYKQLQDALNKKYGGGNELFFIRPLSPQERVPGSDDNTFAFYVSFAKDFYCELQDAPVSEKALNDTVEQIALPIKSLFS